MALLDRRLLKIHRSAFYGTPGKHVHQRDQLLMRPFVLLCWSPFSIYISGYSVCVFFICLYIYDVEICCLCENEMNESN